jgi:hypothetical protein
MEKGFKCDHCQSLVPVSRFIGTAHRNQCPACLWSKHVDQKFAGDRKSACLGLMEPVGLAFKAVGVDKYGQPRQGELMIIHHCLECHKFSLNRIAADDEPKAILELFEKSQRLPDEIKNELKKQEIRLLKEEDRKEVESQLFGKASF